MRQKSTRSFLFDGRFFAKQTAHNHTRQNHAQHHPQPIFSICHPPFKPHPSIHKTQPIREQRLQIPIGIYKNQRGQGVGHRNQSNHPGLLLVQFQPRKPEHSVKQHPLRCQYPYTHKREQIQAMELLKIQIDLTLLHQIHAIAQQPNQHPQTALHKHIGGDERPQLYGCSIHPLLQPANGAADHKQSQNRNKYQMSQRTATPIRIKQIRGEHSRFFERHQRVIILEKPINAQPGNHNPTHRKQLSIVFLEHRKNRHAHHQTTRQKQQIKPKRMFVIFYHQIEQFHIWHNHRR